MKWYEIIALTIAAAILFYKAGYDTCNGIHTHTPKPKPPIVHVKPAPAPDAISQAFDEAEQKVRQGYCVSVWLEWPKGKGMQVCTAYIRPQILKPAHEKCEALRTGR